MANIIMLVLQNTSDESHWLQLNQSLFRVSSLMNGKKDAVREIEVGHTLRPCFFFTKFRIFVVCELPCYTIVWQIGRAVVRSKLVVCSQCQLTWDMYQPNKQHSVP